MRDSDSHLITASAPHDFVSSLAYVIVFRYHSYRRKAVDALRLQNGDRIVEIGCGTGRNFALLERAVGRAGKIFAVDISEVMLERARHRAARHGWSNIELVQSDAATYVFPQSLDGVLSTYTLVLVSAYDRVIENAVHSLKEGKRCVVLDQKLPSGEASRLVPLLNFLSRPLDYRRIVSERPLYESIRRHSGNVRVEEFYFGFVYLAVGEKRKKP